MPLITPPPVVGQLVAGFAAWRADVTGSASSEVTAVAVAVMMVVATSRCTCAIVGRITPTAVVVPVVVVMTVVAVMVS